MFLPKRQNISPDGFRAVIEAEGCRASLEIEYAVDPQIARFETKAQEFLDASTFSVHRASQDGASLTDYTDMNGQRRTFFQLLELRNQFDGMERSDEELFRTNRVIVNHCRRCGLYVVKDGNHRLLRLAETGDNRELDVYELSSEHWGLSEVDMRHFCNCGRRPTSPSR